MGVELGLSFCKPYTYSTFIGEVQENEINLLSTQFENQGIPTQIWEYGMYDNG